MSSEDFRVQEKWLTRLDKKTQETIKKTGLDRKTQDQVFDKNTLLLLGKLISDGVIETLDFPISTGKEANVFRAITPSKDYLCIKIYRTSTSTFRHITKYIIGDPRFAHPNKNRRDIINDWAKKEYKNLERIDRTTVHAPTPLKHIRNVLLMQYIGTANQPAPLLRTVDLPDPQLTYDTLISDIHAMYKDAGLIHADLSEYNILYHEDTPYIIDVGQAVLKEHPNAKEFLKRDLKNINRYFKKYTIKLINIEDTYHQLTDQENTTQ